MNNQQTNRSPLVRKTGIHQSGSGEGNVRWVTVTIGKAKKLVSGLVLEGFRANEVLKTGERKRHYNHYGGTTGRMGAQGGENNAR